ncbi:MAG: UDP-N-acetylmuramoyl-L-alanine--D-glutamate ligase, partial [Gammaproteobacteria bacterium]|nr:UDP-N-acetylmuramoyl-L-alanine--D-glutamate ligase [Gammaproteobacteria bacterium]
DTTRSTAKSHKPAVEIASTLANPGEVVLFSPACASYDMFENYIHRGECFVEIVSQCVRS